MTLRLGISIDDSTVSAVLTRGGRPIWREAASRTEGDTLASALVDVLSRVPCSPKRRPTAGVSLSPLFTHAKKIEGLPKSSDRFLLDRVVSENADRFFLRFVGGITTTRVHKAPDESAWAAAFETSVLEEVVAALSSRGFRRTIFVPVAVAIARVVANGQHRLISGSAGLEISVVAGQLSESHRVLVSHAESESPLVTLDNGSNESTSFAAALGASRLFPGFPLTWSPQRPERHRKAVDRLRLAAAATVLGSSLIAVLLAPTMRAIDFTRNLQRRASDAVAVREVAEVEGALRRVSSDLQTIDRFRSARGRLAFLMGELGRALPESVAIVSLRADSMEATLTVLAPRAATIIPNLAEVGAITTPRILGSVVREIQAGAYLERATIRFGTNRAPMPGDREKGQ